MNRTVLFFFLLLSLTSCKKMFVYHPDEVRPNERDLNAKNIAKLAAVPVSGTYKFILIGDTQRFYDELDDFVDHVNNLAGITFVILDGDLTDFGLNREYNWVAERLSRIHVPVIAVLGNHDMLANGTLIFRKMFGQENFTFSYGSSKFIALNTNSREKNFDGTIPDLGWLRREVNGSGDYENLFVVSHVAPVSGDFDQALAPAYNSILKSDPRTRLSLHAHEHSFQLSQPNENDIDYVQVGSVGIRNYALISVDGTSHSVEEIFY